MITRNIKDSTVVLQEISSNQTTPPTLQDALGCAINKRSVAALEYTTSYARGIPGNDGLEKLSVRTFQNIFLVIERAPAKLEIKWDMFADLDKFAPKGAISAYNSSSYKFRDIADQVQAKPCPRVLRINHGMPSNSNIVEIMTCGECDPEIFPFLADESKGIVINRVWAAIKRECLMVLSKGEPTPKELDAVWTEVNNKLYFSDREGLRIMRCSLDDSDLETLIHTGDWRQDPEDQTL
ncbi:hypothetical protein BJ170DRAFT_717210 [Xylariales sp. AK1849]|nr:hypothetical protein BJ170DRAFT_717210 [Xylariales sp. AK1849]